MGGAAEAAEGGVSKPIAYGRIECCYPSIGGGYFFAIIVACPHCGDSHQHPIGRSVFASHEAASAYLTNNDLSVAAQCFHPSSTSIEGYVLKERATQ